MRELSARQTCILNFLREFIQDHSYPPSIRDICKACNISSTSVVDYNLNILEKAGFIKRDPDVSRGIEVVELSEQRRRLMRVPLIGRIAAGEPIPVPGSDTWSVDAIEMLELPEELTRGKQDVFALRVKGTSMIDALINDGDVVLFERAESADNGEMVAVWLREEKETTLKRFYHEGSQVRLQPANTTMKPIYAPTENVQIQGKVIGVIRSV